MLTVIRKSPGDRIDRSKVLQAVNGSNIQVYGQKEVEFRIGRKTFSIQATVADVQQDIVGWDFISKYKLDMQWSESGLDYFLIDKKAKVKHALRFITIPAGSSRLASVHFKPGQESKEVSAFEIASMRALGSEVPETKIPGKYQKLINQFPGILEPSFKDLSTKHGVTHKINTGNNPPSKAKVRPLLANSEKAIKGKEA